MQQTLHLTTQSTDAYCHHIIVPGALIPRLIYSTDPCLYVIAILLLPYYLYILANQKKVVLKYILLNLKSRELNKNTLFVGG